MAYELIKVSELPELTTPSDPNVLPIQDGDYLKRISFENLKDAAVGDMEGSLAAAYDSTATYAVGDYCIYEGQLYRCTTAITTAEAWTSGHWTAAVLTDDIASGLSTEASTRSANDNALAADIAKALGDLAAVYSTSATYAVGDYCIYQGQLYRCTTAITTAEAWTSGHWAAVTLGNDTRDLRSALNNFETIIYTDNYDTETVEKDISIISDRNSGYVDIYGNVQENASYVYTQRISVTEGDVITGTGTDSNYHVQTALAMQRICAYSDGTPVSASGIASYVMTYTVPSGIDEIIVSYLATMTDVTINRHVNNYVEYVPKMAHVEEDVQHLINSETKAVVRSISPEIVEGKFVNKSGVVQSSTSYYYFEIDNLSEGEVIDARSFYSNTTSIVIPYFRYVCAYDVNNTAQSAKGVENVYGTFTVPKGIVKVAISIQATYPLADGVLVYSNAPVNNLLVNTNVDSAVFASYPQSISGDIDPSESLTITANSVKKNKTILFNGTITAFNQLTIGQGTNDLNSSRYVIDDTNVTYFRGTDAVGVSHAHGLTFADYISVTIDVNEKHIPTLTLMTNGGQFKVTEAATWVGCMPNVYVLADASTSLIGSTLTFICKDIDKPLWIFGDSYVSYTADRWTYYIEEMGYDGYLLNGYSGEEAAHAMEDLRNLLKYGTPKYIVWALGMNNADTESAVGSIWKSVYDELVALCNANNITLILCTIPNVPSRNHTYKNQIVINSGYKYIDFASAVGALDDTTWYSGMLSNDGVHPTIQGGMALASAVLKDFPYIVIK